MVSQQFRPHMDSTLHYILITYETVVGLSVHFPTDQIANVRSYNITLTHKFFQ